MSSPDAANQLIDLLRYARAQGADAADAIWLESMELSVSQRLGKPEDIGRSESSGVGIRVFVGEQSANVSTSRITPQALRESCDAALAIAKLSLPDSHAGLAPADRLATHIPALDLCEPDEPAIETLREWCAQAEDTARAVQGITNSEGASAGATRGKVWLATSNGFAGGYETSASSLSVSLIAGEGDAKQRDYDYSVARYSSDIADAAEIGTNAAARTLKKMNPRKVKSCAVPVIFDPRVGRGLVAQLAHAISGSAITRGTSFLKDAMHTQIFHSSIQMIDEPHRVRGLGSKPFDGEGVKNGSLALIEKGELKSWLLDMRSANQLGLATTGHASRGLDGSPHPSSTNLTLLPSDVSVADLMSDMKDGFYVTETSGMGINLITGDYSQGASGFWIEKGELTYAVGEVTIASNLREMFKSMSVANDLIYRYATNAPTLRIEQMTIAGS